MFLSKNERFAIYQQAVRDADAAYAAHSAAVALHPDLVTRLEQANENFNNIEAALEDGVDLAEYDAANEEWGEAQNALDAATRNTLTVWMSAQLRVNETYNDYLM